MKIATKNRPPRRSRTLVGCLSLGALVGVLTQINAEHSPTDWLVILAAIAIALTAVAVIATAIERGRHDAISPPQTNISTPQDRHSPTG